MSQAEVAALHLGASRKLRRWGGVLAEQFLELGIVVQYGGDNDDAVTFVEFSGPVFPVVNGVRLGTPRYDEERLRQVAEILDDQFGGTWVDQFGVALSSEGENTYVVSVFSKGEIEKATGALTRELRHK